jgi:short subunit dehydrogenase
LCLAVLRTEGENEEGCDQDEPRRQLWRGEWVDGRLGRAWRSPVGIEEHARRSKDEQHPAGLPSSGHYGGTMDLNDLGFEHGYQIMRAYGRSKLAAVLFTRELAKRLTGTEVTVNALHPGAVATSIWDRAPVYTRPIFSLAKRLFMISPAAGAETIVYLATSPEVEGKTGLYFEKNRPKVPSRLAQDDALAERLWDASERLVKLPEGDHN